MKETGKPVSVLQRHAGRAIRLLEDVFIVPISFVLSRVSARDSFLAIEGHMP